MSHKDILIGQSAESAFDSKFSFASSSTFVSTSSSGSHRRTTSYDEATNIGYILLPHSTEPAPVSKPNLWCVTEQRQIYRDAGIIIEKEKMDLIVIDERQSRTRRKHYSLAIHQLFERHICKWMNYSPGSYNKNIMREFMPPLSIFLHNFTMQLNLSIWVKNQSKLEV